MREHAVELIDVSRVFIIGMDRFFHGGGNLVRDGLVLELPQVIPDRIIGVDGLLYGLMNGEVDDVAVIRPEGELGFVQQPKLSPREETVSEKAVVEVELCTETRGLRYDRLYPCARLSDGDGLGTTGLVQPAGEDVHSSRRTGGTLLEQGIPKADIDISHDDGGILEGLEIVLDIAIAHRGGWEVDAGNAKRRGRHGDRVRGDGEVGHDAPGMLGPDEVDAPARSTSLMWWFGRGGEEATVLLPDVVIDEPRLGDEEEIVDGVDQPTADLELVGREALDIHVAYAQTHAGSGNFVPWRSREAPTS